MGLLYFFETTIEFRNINLKHMYKSWLDIVEAFNQYPITNTGVEIKQFWKVRLTSSRPTVAADTRQIYGHGSLKVASWFNNLFVVPTASAYWVDKPNL